MKKTSQYILVSILLASSAFIVIYNKDRYVPVYENILTYTGVNPPCSQPIYYFINNFDERFGKTKESFIEQLRNSASIWNKIQGKDILIYDEVHTGKMSNFSNYKLAINLIYDDRQRTTDKLNQINSTIEDSKSNYNGLEVQYYSLKQQYENKKSDINNLTIQYEASKLAYEKDLARINSQKSISKDSFNQIEKERLALNQKANEINNANRELNIIVDQLNAKVKELNSIGKDINGKIGTFNSVSQTTGPEFQEGEYVRNENGQQINIYEFKDQNKLTRVLAHEFGHAIGLDHVSGKDSIMNAYNESSVIIPSTQDQTEFGRVCHK